MRAAIVAMLFLLTACASLAPATAPDSGHVSRFVELRPGISTVADAVAVMGEPKAMSQLADGSATMVWMEWDGPAHLTQVGLLFDKNGKFVRLLTITKV